MFYICEFTALSVTVSADAALLMAEMLRVFVQGKDCCVAAYSPLDQDETLNSDVLVVPEAAVRSQKQAESEDFNQVDIEHFEKILPQLVCHSMMQKWDFSV